jgi:aspartate aminotransferase
MDRRISQRIQQIAPSATLAVSEKARQLRERGVQVISFGAGEPDFDTPEHIKEAAIRALHDGDTKYPSPGSGKTALREAICAYLDRWCGVSYQPSQVCVTIGAKDALHLAFAVLLNPGDEVLIPLPYWVSYPDQVRLAGGSPVFVRGRWEAGGKIGPQELRAAITPRTRVLVLNSPCNPTGAVYSRAELDALAAVVRDTDIAVVSDEIYHRLVVADQPATCVASLPGMLERTITVNGLSKTFAMTGWRLGYAAGPAAIIEAMGRLVGQTTSGAASFVQTAAVAALGGDQSCVDRMRAAYRARGQRMFDALSALPGVRCSKPAGAFYCFPDVSGTFERLGLRDADGFADLALERAHVAVVSGAAFGSPAHVRLSYATSDANIEEGLRRLAKLLG